MTREKEIEQAMKDSVAETIYASGWNMTPQATDLLECAFTKGAEWADKTMIDKACQWLEENYYNIYQGTWQEIKEQFIDDFKKAMEE